MLLIEGGLLYDHDGDTDRPAQLDVLIDGPRIVAVGPHFSARLASTRSAGEPQGY